MHHTWYMSDRYFFASEPAGMSEHTEGMICCAGNKTCYSSIRSRSFLAKPIEEILENLQALYTYELNVYNIQIEFAECFPARSMLCIL